MALGSSRVGNLSLCGRGRCAGTCLGAGCSLWSRGVDGDPWTCPSPGPHHGVWSENILMRKCSEPSLGSAWPSEP